LSAPFICGAANKLFTLYKNSTPVTCASPALFASCDESAQPDYITSKPDDEIWLHRWNETAYQGNNSKGWEGQKVFDGAKYDWNGSAWIAQ